MKWDRTLAGFIDHTVLRGSATEADVWRACEDAVRYGFATVVVAPFYLPLIVERLHGTGVRTCTVVSFPLGMDSSEDKAATARRQISDGAQEIDVVMNVSAFLSGHLAVVEDEVRRVAAVCSRRSVFKLIIETEYLSARQIEKATELAIACGVDYVKTSTGFGGRGVTLEDIQTIKRVAGDRAGIKASGGITTGEFARELLDAGATRLGCSASLEVIKMP